MILALLVTAGSVRAQEQPVRKRIDIKALTIRPEGENVDISFIVQAGERAIRSNQMIKVMPVLVNGESRRELTPVAVRGRKSYLSQKRRAAAANVPLTDEGMILIERGKTYNYQTSVPASVLSPGSTLVFESDVMICLNEGEAVQVADNDLVAIRTEVIAPPIVIPEPKVTVAEMIAAEYPFVERVPETGIRFTDDMRELALIVYYRLNKFDIDFSYRENAHILRQIITAIKLIQESDDSKISGILLAGFASPEGAAQHNQMLGERRGNALRDYLVKETGLTANQFVMHNGGADWEGLRMLVEKSDMRYRDQVLEIIENTPVWDAKNNVGRMGKIMRLDGGNVYRSMLKEFFPDLRNAAYIKVYYENK